MFIRWIDKPGGDRHEVVDRTIWAWLGLVLAIVLVVGAWMNMQAAGEGLADVRDRVSAMTAGCQGSCRPRRRRPPTRSGAAGRPAAGDTRRVRTPAAPEPPEPDDAPRAS